MNKFNKVLIFEVSSNMGHFRKSFTNMCKTSYIVPPRTVITGIIGAMLGIQRNVNPENFSKDKSFISVKVLNIGERINIMKNYVKDLQRVNKIRGIETRKQILIEYVREPKYRIYFSHTDKELYENVKKRLETKSYFYSTYLGSAVCLAQINYVGEFEMSVSKKNKEVKIDSLIPIDAVKNVVSGTDRMFSEKFHNEMDNQRNVTEYKTFIFSDKDVVVNSNYPAYNIGDIKENIYEM